MGSTSDDEEVLRQEYLKEIDLPVIPKSFPVSESIENTVSQANVKTGEKGFIALAISSFLFY
ncbi:MAG: hypothetical protein ACJAUP_003870 [Cellvibrionaceae bacterium]|jgi:hypothetical protein